MSDLDRVERAAEDAGRDGLEQAARRVLDEAIRNLPVGDPAEDPNPAVALRDHGRVEPDGRGGFVVVFDTVYAAKQHEDLRLKHPRGGGAKYLERALTTLAPTLEGIVGGAVHARLASGLLSSDPRRPR